MKHLIFSLLSLCALSIAAEPDPNFHIYLCIGQSNMNGSAPIEEQDKTGVDRFVAMATTDFAEQQRDQGEWYTAVPPLSQPGQELSPADYFGRTMAASLPDSIKVGAIVVAISGSDIRLFDHELYLDYIKAFDGAKWYARQVGAYGDDPYGRLIHLARQAQRQGVIKGILLHQGETNEHDTQWPSYVAKVYSHILSDLNLSAAETPLIAGEVAHMSEEGKCASMNEIIATLPAQIPTAHVVSSKDCTTMPDHVHFNSAGVRKLGRRYAETMIKARQAIDNP